MNQYNQEFRLQDGMDVVSSDGDKVGEVSEISTTYFAIQQGFFFPKTYYVPASAIASVDDKVHLNVSKEEAMNQDPSWDQRPDDTMDAGAATWPTAGETPASGLERDPEPFEHDQDSPRTHVNEDDDLRIDVAEEELVARRREVDRGGVLINKDVVEEEQSIDVPVTEERVEVTRHAVDRDAAPGDTAFQEDTIEVPVHGEEIEVSKEARVVEEIEVDKVAEQRTEHVSDTVRREEVNVDGEQVGDASANAPKSGRRNSKKRR